MSTGVLASTDSLVSIGTGPTTSGLLETGAASSSASSGGALVDAAGNVTGIVLSPVGDSRMTYAVPIETALSIADDLRLHGYARHGALGINGIDAPAGPTVTGVVVGGPADRAGIRVGDIVERVDKHEVDSMEDVMALVRHDAPGQPIVVELRRGTQRLSVDVTLRDPWRELRRTGAESPGGTPAREHGVIRRKGVQRGCKGRSDRARRCRP